MRRAHTIKTVKWMCNCPIESGKNKTAGKATQGESMKKPMLIAVFAVTVLVAQAAYSIDLLSDVFWNAGYIYSPETPLGFNAGLFGFDLAYSFPLENKDADASKKYNSDFSQVSLSYGVKLFDWLRVPVGVSLYNDAINDNAGGNSLELNKIGFNLGAEIIVNPFSNNWKLSIKAQTINFNHFFAGAGLVYVFDSYRPPSPSPAPRPQPAPSPALLPEPVVNNAGTIYYSYDGTGSVYLSETVFYRCSSGEAVGYVEGGTIYAFSGRVLGFYENDFIYDKNGNPVGAADPKGLGTDAAAKRPVAKTEKQDLPAKQPKDSVNRPRLRNAYRGGFLQDIF
jgi:hypothetical protein